MRVTDLDIISDDVEVMCISLKMPQYDEKYLAKAIIGLDANEIVPKFYGFGLTNGERFYEYTLRPREIVIRVVLNPNWYINQNHSDLRDEAYRMISSTRSSFVKIILKNGASSVAQIDGVITKFEVPHFSKVPELQMTIKCDDPIFRAIAHVEMEHDDLKAFSPFEIVDAISTCPHGFSFDVKLLAAKSSFLIQDKETNPSWKFEVAPNGGFLVNDMLCVSGEEQNKYVYLERDGVKTHLADYVTTGSLWPIIFPGYNEFHFNYENQIEWQYLHYRPTYWGV